MNQGESIIVRGHITGMEDAVPYYASYILHANLHWEVQSISVIVKSHQTVELFFEKKQEGWFDNKWNGAAFVEGLYRYRYLTDSFHQYTTCAAAANARGTTQEITVLYFKLPEGEFYPMRQSYTNIDDRFYKYENIDGEYAAMLELDEDGMVIYYPGRWQRAYP